jgi:sugar/nucleoside kinase (ribokinase family)
MTASLPGRRTHIPSIVGTGFIALDVLITYENPDQPSFSTGGTCGNILAILGYLGWSSVAISRLAKDFAGDWILKDLQRWGVNLLFAQLAPQAATPIVIQRNIDPREGKSHRFVWTCPHCGAWLPRYRALTRESVTAIRNKVDVPKVFFTDRVSPAAIEMARQYGSRGAIVYFEPSGIGDEKLFQRMLDVTHVVKYSEERMGHYDWTRKNSSLLLQIETLGSDGVRFKSCLPQARFLGWQRIDAFEIANFRDSSGSGDWFTAGLLHSVGAGGLQGLRDITTPTLNQSIRFAQALAAWNCAFAGARGAMYALSKKDFITAFENALNGKPLQKVVADEIDSSLSRTLDSLCPSCPERLVKLKEVRATAHGTAAKRQSARQFK